MHSEKEADGSFILVQDTMVWATVDGARATSMHRVVYAQRVGHCNMFQNPKAVYKQSILWISKTSTSVTGRTLPEKKAKHCICQSYSILLCYPGPFFNFNSDLLCSSTPCKKALLSTVWWWLTLSKYLRPFRCPCGVSMKNHIDFHTARTVGAKLHKIKGAQASTVATFKALTLHKKRVIT